MSTTLRPNGPVLRPPAAPDTSSDAAVWSGAVPALHGPRATLRGLHADDAGALFSFLTTEPVGQFILPPPDTVERFSRFIEWTQRQQESGRHLCFGIVPTGHDAPVGLIQIRREMSDSSTAEWGFVLSERFWGTGLFVASAAITLKFLFGDAGLHRLEARTIVDNGRAIGALQKLGAAREGLLRRGLCRNGQYFDQILWSIMAEEWHSHRPAPAATRLH
jgi:ribosomal-protein-alanine N-acetyltransferase